jgi:hypothetical protein
MMTMNDEQLREFTNLPAAQSCRLIDFDTVEVLVLESFPPQYVLVVTGTKPYRNMKVDLVPLVYIRQPEYWGIEVVGCLSGIGLPSTAPYTVSVPLAGITGTQGIEVIGATKSEKREIPPVEPPGESGLFRHWVHSFEEDSADMLVYRPIGFDFPPAFGRDGFEIKPDGGFILYSIGPADGVVESPGHWTMQAENEIEVHFDDPEREPLTLRIASCAGDVLRIRR